MPVIFSSSWQVCEIFGARSGPASDVCEFVYVWLCGRLFSQLELAICCREPLHDVSQVNGSLIVCLVLLGAHCYLLAATQSSGLDKRCPPASFDCSAMSIALSH